MQIKTKPNLITAITYRVFAQQTKFLRFIIKKPFNGKDSIFKYRTPLYNKGFDILVYYILIFPRSYILSSVI